MGKGVTQGLVERARAVRFEDLPADVLRVARQCVLDLLGVTLAGTGDPLVERLVEAIGVGDGPCPLIGRGARSDPRTAALVNGTAAHALDYDDTHWIMNGHPTVPVLPALLALAEARGLGGEALLTALVAGVEVECRLGALMNPAHYELGFHATGTLGAFGAAAACARMLELDAERFGHALGLAGTQAAGLKSGFGTMAKPLHAGRAAEVGLTSALLAERGFTAQAAVVETAQGFAATHGVPALDPARMERPGERLLIRDTLFKYHAACYLTHSAIDAAARLSAEQGFAAGDVERVRVTVSPTCLGVCNIAEPQTGLEGKFSLRATVAMALLGDDTAALSTYSDARMAAPELVALRDRVEVAAGEDRVATRSRVRIELAGGATHELALDLGVPAGDLAAQQGRLEQKFSVLATAAVGAERAAAVAAAVGRLESLPVAELTALL